MQELPNTLGEDRCQLAGRLAGKRKPAFRLNESIIVLIRGDEEIVYSLTRF
jgi:hypothetical protein